MSTTRCPWAGSSPAMIEYHDNEWGVPSRDDRHLFEMLTLEGAQAGLSWSTILNKRAGYRKAFKNFDAAKVAKFSAADVKRLMLDAGIVRNRLKIESTINNAGAVLAVKKEFGSFAKYIWSFVDDTPIDNRIKSTKDLPAETDVSKRISKDMKKRGFRFVGPTVIYAFMQAVGMTNDHLINCACRVKKKIRV